MKNLYLIVGASGTGKTTLVTELCKRYGYHSVESYTDRPPRYDGERGHIFLSESEFDELTDIHLYTEFNGHRYCVTEELLAGNDLYVIDLAGVRDMQESYHGKKPFVCIGLTQTPEVLKQRMIGRGDTEEQADARILHDKAAFAEMERFCDTLVCNEDIEETVSFVQDFILRTENNTKI